MESSRLSEKRLHSSKYIGLLLIILLSVFGYSLVKPFDNTVKLYTGRGFEITIPKEYSTEENVKYSWVSFNKDDGDKKKIVFIYNKQTSVQDPCTIKQEGYPNTRCTTLNGVRALDWSTETPPYPMGPLQYRYTLINKGVLFEIQFSNIDVQEKDHLLSTFRFTN